MKKTWHGYLLIAPLLAGCLVFYAIPFGLVLWYSLLRGGAGEFVGLLNYANVTQNATFSLAFGNSFCKLLS